MPFVGDGYLLRKARRTSCFIFFLLLSAVIAPIFGPKLKQKLCAILQDFYPGKRTFGPCIWKSAKPVTSVHFNLIKSDELWDAIACLWRKPRKLGQSNNQGPHICFEVGKPPTVRSSFLSWMNVSQRDGVSTESIVPWHKKIHWCQCFEFRFNRRC